MDPNVTLSGARDAAEHLLTALDAGDDDTAVLHGAQWLADTFTALDGWLVKGGFLPDAWRTPIVPAYGVNPLIDQLLHVVFTTALEGGIGYWSQALEYHWSVDGRGDTADLKGFYAVIEDADDEAGDDNFPRTRIDRALVARAFERMAAGPIEFMPDAQRHKFVSALYDALGGNDNDFDFDAGDADNVVQVGVLGKVVFG